MSNQDLFDVRVTSAIIHKGEHTEVGTELDGLSRDEAFGLVGTGRAAFVTNREVGLVTKTPEDDLKPSKGKPPVGK